MENKERAGQKLNTKARSEHESTEAL